jgi:hypothetical protein
MTRPRPALSRIALALLASLAVAAPVASQNSSDKGRSKDSGSASGSTSSSTRGSRSGSASSVDSGSSTSASGTRSPRPSRDRDVRNAREGDTRNNSNQRGAKAEGKAGQNRPASRKPSSGRRSGGSRTGAKASEGLSGFNITIDRNARVLRLAPERGPADVLRVNEGDEFWTEVRLESLDTPSFDFIRIVLDYPEDVIEPIAIHDGSIAANLATDPRTRVNARAGLLMYEGSLAEPMPVPKGAVLRVQWKARRADDFAEIRFDTWGRQQTALRLGTADLLGNAFIEDDGVLSMELQVQPGDASGRAAAQDAAAFDFGSFERLGGTRLIIAPPRVQPVVGEIFSVDLVLDNRANSAIDGLEARLEFDPSVLRVVDTDYNNPVTIGTNILDGPFRRAFPFDFSIENAVHQQLGRIDYKVGISNENELRGRYGTFARVYFMPLRPSVETFVRFTFSKSKGYPSTMVSYLGGDVLGDPRLANDGTVSTSFGVLNGAPAAVAEAGP